MSKNILRRHIATAGKANRLMWKIEGNEKVIRHYIAGQDFIAMTNILTPRELGTLVEHIGTIPATGELAHMSNDPKVSDSIDLIMREMMDLYFIEESGERIDFTGLSQHINDNQAIIFRKQKDYIYIDSKFAEIVEADIIEAEYYPQHKMVHLVIINDYAKDSERQIDLFIRTHYIKEEYQSKYLVNLAQVIFNV